MHYDTMIVHKMQAMQKDAWTRVLFMQAGCLWELPGRPAGATARSLCQVTQVCHRAVANGPAFAKCWPMGGRIAQM